MGLNKPKYYYFSKRQGRWLVQRKFNGKHVNFGQYSTEEEAKMAVELFHKYGWNKENNWRVKAEVKKIFKKVGDF